MLRHFGISAHDRQRFGRIWFVKTVITSGTSGVDASHQALPPRTPEKHKQRVISRQSLPFATSTDLPGRM